MKEEKNKGKNEFKKNKNNKILIKINARWRQ